MDKNIFEINDAQRPDAMDQVQSEGSSELSDLQLALVGGGIGDTIL
jgi:hypothetical protein